MYSFLMQEKSEEYKKILTGYLNSEKGYTNI